MKKNYLKKTLLGFLLLFIAFPAQALTPNDESYFEQWYLKQINVAGAWDTSTGSTQVVVAVLDTGIDLNHPDLEQNIWTNNDEIPNDGIDNDKNGYVDDYFGYDFVDNDNTPIPNKKQSYKQASISHGTIVAGIIGAVGNNEIGISGMNWNTKLMSVRILNNLGSGESTHATLGIEYAIANGADVINLSFTGFGDDPRLEEAVKKAYEAGIVVVAAVGNSENGTNVDNTPIYPACYGEDKVEDWILGVAATDKLDGRAEFSNYGSLCTDISAPGLNIFSTAYQDDNWPQFINAFYISGESGTSMAVPIVAGAAALLKSNHPSLSPKDIKNILRLSVDPIHEDGIAQGKMGAGRLNVANAINLSDRFADLSMEKFIESGELIKISCSEKATENDICQAVYFHSADGRRHAFPNDKVFFSWFDDFNSVKEVTSEFMSSLTLGKNVTYHPGTRMVKFTTSNTVYAVAQKGILRAINSEETAKALYGDNWNQQIDDIADVFFGNYKIGEKIQNIQDYNAEVTKTTALSLNFNF